MLQALVADVTLRDAVIRLQQDGSWKIYARLSGTTEMRVFVGNSSALYSLSVDSPETAGSPAQKQPD
jgi:hypothetical protein